MAATSIHPIHTTEIKSIRYIKLIIDIIDLGKFEAKGLQRWADIQNMKNVANMINMIEERFKATEFQDISKYLRHMATTGGVFLELDNELIKDVRNAVQTASNNINQITRRMNVTGRIYMDDVEQLKSESSAMRQELQKITEMLEVYADIEKSSRNYYWLE